MRGAFLKNVTRRRFGAKIGVGAETQSSDYAVVKQVVVENVLSTHQERACQTVNYVEERKSAKKANTMKKVGRQWRHQVLYRDEMVYFFQVLFYKQLGVVRLLTGQWGLSRPSFNLCCSCSTCHIRDSFLYLWAVLLGFARFAVPNRKTWVWCRDGRTKARVHCCWTDYTRLAFSRRDTK